MSTALATPSNSLVTVNEGAIATIDQIVDECGLISTAEATGITAAFKMAKGLALMRAAITDEMMKDVMALQGTSLGFRTDKDDKGGYPQEIVKDCAIECLMRGGRLHGNEFNIIANRCYLTKEYFIRTMSTLPGLTNLVLEFGVPQLSGDKGALVPVEASWIYHGRPGNISYGLNKLPDGKIFADNRIPVRVNSGMGTDAILGKAERKVRARILSMLTNTVWADGDVDDSSPAPVANGNGNGNSLKNRIANSVPLITKGTTVSADPEPAKEEPAENNNNDAPFGTATPTQDAPNETVSQFAPKDGEEVKPYYSRVSAAIATADGSTLDEIQTEIDKAAKSGFLKGLRHPTLTKEIAKRVEEISKS